MAAKTTTKKKSAPARGAAAALPPGLKPSTRRISPALRKMIMEDRAIASGGRNIVHRQRASTSR